MNKRQHTRFTVDDVDISAKTIFAIEIEILDISLGGACIKTPKCLKIHGNYIIKLENNNTILPLKGTVLWEKLSGSALSADGEMRPVFTVGIAFREVTENEMDELKNFIAGFGIPDKQRFINEIRLSAVRFQIHTNGMPPLDSPETYTVKDISLSGMLVETEYDIRIEHIHPIKLFLPDEQFPIHCQGRVATCNEIPFIKPKRFDVGIEFLDMSEKDRSRLSTFIKFLYEI